MNQTMKTFGYPESCVREYDHWAVLLRPKQVTLGALILVCKDEARAFGDITPAAFGELATVVSDIEQALKRAFAYDKINYLMLMMVDPDVHFHVIPRYAETPTFAQTSFPDAGWPGPPALGSPTETTTDTRRRIAESIVSGFDSRA